MAKVQLQGIGKTYGKNVVAVKNFNLEIEDQEFMILVGPSGCGKTTTLRMIAGLEEITCGHLYINGSPMNEVEAKNRNIAMVFQNYALYPHMTVYENMAFSLQMRKMSREKVRKKVEEAAKILSLEALLDRRPKALSGGEKQRVAMGRALVREPSVFLMDEPLSNLDAKLRVQMRSELAHLHKRLKATMIYVTHDQVEAMTLGTRIAVMKDGSIQQADTPERLYNRPCNRFVAGFIGSPQMNFAEAIVARKAGVYVVEIAGQELQLPDTAQNYEGKTITAGIRPEDIRAQKGGCGGVLERREYLGAEVYLYVKAGHVRFTVRGDVGEDWQEGEPLGLQVSQERLHFFDKDGLRIFAFDTAAAKNYNKGIK